MKQSRCMQKERSRSRAMRKKRSKESNRLRNRRTATSKPPMLMMVLQRTKTLR